ncbi:hypothetical protein GJAV_G00040340 [Gymnothorax javanicus]|nr:hypothetical protein GJAV_G00040340 [Gymnothorax javanicus]
MEPPVPDNEWRSHAFRQKVVAQIEEAMRKAGTAHAKSSNDMENHVFVKAKSRDEYLSLVARLIIHFRDIHKRAQRVPGNTTNLLFHHEHDHKEHATPSTGKAKLTQPTIDQGMQAPCKMPAEKQDQITDALLQLFMKKVLPFSLVEHESFIKFVSLLDPRYNLPNRKQLVAKLEKKKGDVKNKLSAEIDTVRDVAITHDGWTSIATESYETITAHFLTADWDLRSVVLQTTKVSGSHTGENIAATLAKAQETWKLPTPVAVTDNAANEEKSFQILRWERFGCYGHRINLVVRKALAVPEVARLVGKGRKLVTFFHQSSSITSLLLAKQQLLLGKEVQGHKLTQDVVTRWDSTHAMLSRILEQTAAIRAIISDPLMSKTQITALHNCMFTFEEQSTVEGIVEVLEPFTMATSIICADKTPTLHKVMPLLLKIEKRIEVTAEDLPTVVKVKDILREFFQSRSQDKQLALLACALNPFTRHLEFLPESERREAHRLLQDEAELVEVPEKVPEPSGDPATVTPDANTEQPLHSESDLSRSTAQPSTSSTQTPLSPEPQSVQSLLPKKRAKMDMDSWLQDVIDVPNTQANKPDKHTLVQEEVNRYLCAMQVDTDLDILQWWKRHEQFYPILSVLAKKFLAIPASSVPAERVFSLAGAVVNKKRARLSSGNVDLTVFLNKNMDMYW